MMLNFIKDCSMSDPKSNYLVIIHVTVRCSDGPS
jgi:hypothetical protein